MSTSQNKEIKRIVFIGRKTVGKSSLVKLFLGPNGCYSDENTAPASIVKELSVDLPPFGPVLLVDTPNIDSKHESGKKQLEESLTDLTTDNFVIVVLDAREKLVQEEKNIFHYLKNHTIQFLAAVNKIEHGINSDLINALRALNIVHFEISCKEKVGIDALKTRITRLLPA